MSRQKFTEKCVNSVVFIFFLLLIFLRQSFLALFRMVEKKKKQKRRVNEGREEQGTAGRRNR